MTINATLDYLKSEQSIIVLCFSDAVTTVDKYLKGAGGIADDGFPLPFPGVILAIQVYDGSDLSSTKGNVEFSADDRISVYAVYDLGEFTVYVRKNGINTSLSAGGVAPNTNLLVTVTCKVTED